MSRVSASASGSAVSPLSTFRPNAIIRVLQTRRCSQLTHPHSPPIAGAELPDAPTLAHALWEALKGGKGDATR